MTEPRNVLSMCVLCPGICVTECPVYMATHIRASAPNNLARIALKFMEGSKDMEDALWLCTGCRSCEYACPMGNKVWEAVRVLRGQEYISSTEARVERLTNNSKPGLLVVSSSKPNVNIVKTLGGDYSLYWVDSGVISETYWSGRNPILNLNGIEFILADDMDALTPLSLSEKRLVSPLKILKSLGAKRLLGDNGYTLHIPCKTPREYRDDIIGGISQVLGSPESIVEGCVAGGGGLPVKHPDLAREIAMYTMRNTNPGRPVVTLCSNAKMLLRKLGYQSLTLLDLIEEAAQR
ncbi:MAG: (Fe-S)-binding protein [Desulfurococcales archaeon]|nr:(Fe-S)-binding protein [Desulfurococcales archaeon]